MSGRLRALACTLMLGGAALTASAQPPADTALTAPGAPVTVNRDTLFLVSANVLSFSPEDRARIISEKLRRIIGDHSMHPDSIFVQESEAGSEIVAGDIIVMIITEADARSAGMDRTELAAANLSRIRSTLYAARSQNSLTDLLMACGYSLATLIGLMFVLWLAKRLFDLVLTKLRVWEGSRIPAVKIQSLEILTAARATQVLIRAARMLRLVGTLLILYAATSLILGFFPQTRHVSSFLASRLWRLVEPLVMAVVNYLPNLVVVVFLLVIGYYAIKVVRFFFESLKSGRISLPGFYVEWTDTTYKIARLAVIALFLVLLFPYLPGSDSPAFKGVSIFVALLFSLGSTSIVANIVAGVILTYMRAFKVGDRVKIADTIGDIVEKTILITRIRTIKNVFITVPNAMVLGSHIINYSSSVDSEPLLLHTSVTIGYDAPWRTVHDLLMSAALATDHILKDPRPFVLQLSLDDFYVRYELNAHTDSPRDMARIYSDLHQNIQDRFNEAGMEIMSPHYKALRDGNRSALPGASLPADYVTPAFRVQTVAGSSSDLNEPPG